MNFVYIASILLGIIALYGILSPKKTETRVTCTKDLYKSTYNGFAFEEGKEYFIIERNEYIWVLDEQGEEFSFTEQPNDIMYVFSDYFKPSP